MTALPNDTLLKNEGLELLAKHLGLVGAERFVMLMRREPFDYTEWRQRLYNDMTLDELCDDAERFENINP